MTRTPSKTSGTSSKVSRTGCDPFNVSVAEIDYQDLWQRGLVAAVTVASDRAIAERTLESVEKKALPPRGRAH